MNKNNSDIRRRKPKDHNGRPPQKRKFKPKESGTKIPISFLTALVSGLLLIFFMIFYAEHFPWHVGHKAVDNFVSVLGYYEPVHAIVLDAGSTGSRVLAFTFHKAFLNRDYLVLDKELFVYTKPGLSSYADEPHKAVESISKLIDKAKDEIPQEYWSKTPIMLKATAGLRLLPAEKAEALLQAIRKLFSELPFITDKNSVSIMHGTDEGIFSWFTVNFLLNSVNNPAKTVAALDLGGGSTQVTFSALAPDTLKQSEFIHKAFLPFGYTEVYTNSYLGLGLMAARKEIITKNHENAVNVTSICVNPIIKNKKFHYGGSDYYVSGLQENYPTLKHGDKSDFGIGETVPIVDYDECAKLVKAYVLSKAKPPVELSSKKIFAFSYYFDRAAEVGLIDEATGGTVKISNFKNAAQKSCKDPNTEQPFMCLDLTFISVLLEEGLGINESEPIYLFKKIKLHEVSWALGAAFNVLKGRI